MRRSVAAICLFACVAGCASDRTSPPQPSGPVTGGASAAPRTSPGASAAPGTSAIPPGRTAAPPTAGTVGGGGSVPVADDDGQPGAEAPLYLRRSVPRIVIEVDAVSGRAPSPETLSLLRSRLAEVADKPEGISVLATQTIPAHGPGAWTIHDLAATEHRYRSTHTTAQAASMYLMYVDGKPPQEGALGVTYTSSAAALFGDEIESSATLLVSAPSIERATTVHEAGHMLSLVNLGYRSPRPHEDPQHRGHSNDPGSVMYWAVDNIGVATLLGGHTEPPTAFDADDKADLADIRSGKLP